ncbi:MAG: hypothetical protein IT428_12220 [Planctomycetaceae bacterium]|nr:hypothetical protein [Planctomycetaceae bacterium]
MTGNKPLQVFRRRGVKVSVFENIAGESVYHKLTVHKIYRAEGGEWKTTNSLGRDDVPVVRMLLARAWEFILDREAGAPESAVPAVPPPNCNDEI